MIGLINNKLVKDLKIEEWKTPVTAYEVIRMIDGKPLFLNEHLARLKKTSPNINDKNIMKLIIFFIGKFNKKINKNIFLSYNMQTEYSMICFIESFYPPQKWFLEGIDIGILDIKRDNPNFKIYNELYKKKVDNYLMENNYFETLIVNNGFITEGSRSNVFFIKKETVITPPLCQVLPGITREKVFGILKELKYSLEERNVEALEIEFFDGVFITGTSIDVLPIKAVLNKTFNTSNNGIYNKIYKSYNKLKVKNLKNIPKTLNNI